VPALLEPIGFTVVPGSQSLPASGTAGDVSDGEAEPVGSDAGAELDVVVPSWRPDTTTETDVIEEVARHLGYSSIVPRRPSRATTGELSDRQRLRRRLRSLLVGLGASEAMPTPLLSAEDLVVAGLPTDAVRVTNPLAAEESLLRPSLRPGLVRAVAHNAAHRNPVVRLFEVGRVFLPPSGAAVLPEEPEFLAVVLAGEEAPAAVAVLDVVCDALALTPELRAAEPAGLHPTRSAEVVVAGTVVGLVGQLDPAVTDAVGMEVPVGWLELDIDALADAGIDARTYRPVSRFPSSDVDLAFELDEGVPAFRLRQVIADAAGDLLVGLELFDVYRGSGVPEGRRSLAHRLRLQAMDRTLTDADVAAVRQRVVDGVTAELPASLR
jgi:phenylalanyl-tRNA synthetase beta chain